MIVAAFLSRGLLVSLVAMVMLLVLRRTPGATRHAIVSLALFVLLVLPVALPLVWSRSLPHAVVPLPTPPIGLARIRTVSSDARGSIGADLPVSPETTPSRVSEPSPVLASLRRVGAVAPTIYFAVAALLLLRLGLGWERTVRLARASRPLDGDSVSGVRVRVSDRIEVPLALWWGRGIVLLPKSQEEWTPERRDAVLRHEAAHLERGDLLTLFVGGLALALHWPNPLVWRLVATARRSAEDAADDAVLRTGLAPDRYSAHLLELARASEPRTPLLALPIARQSDLDRRIRRMLHPRYRSISRRSRGLTTVAALTVASLFFGITGTLAIGFSSQRADRSSPAQIQARSWAPDVRLGRSTAATSANGFVGTLSNGLKARVTLVGQVTPNGVRCWTPNGRPVRADLAMFTSILRREPHMRVIVTRFDATSPDADAGLGSGSQPGDPSVMGFAGGGTRRGPGGFECYSLIEIPKEDSATASFTLAVNSEGWQPATVLSGEIGPKPDTELMREIAVESPATGRPLLRDKSGVVLRDAGGRQRTRDVPGLYRVGFTVSMDEQWRQFRVRPIDRRGRRLQPVWTDAGQKGDTFLRSFYFKVRPENVKEITIESQPWRHVEIIGVAMRPKT